MSKEIDGRTYLTATEAAQRLDISRMTMNRWAQRGATPTGYDLEVIQDTLTNQYYIPESIVTKLSKPDNRYQSVVLRVQVNSQR